jgi:SAM-dependent methyltransferase
VVKNPWLQIPEADYVGHMNSPAVGQRAVLNRLLGEALEQTRPKTLLVLGCSNGNGLEHVDPDITSRVVVVDINPQFLFRLRERFESSRFALDVRCRDVADMELESDTFDLVHAALLFEYVDWRIVLPHIATALRRGGVLSVVLQTPSASSPAVTPTAFSSLRALESQFRFVEPSALLEAAHVGGLSLRRRHSEALPAGKAFEVMHFMKDAA